MAFDGLRCRIRVLAECRSVRAARWIRSRPAFYPTVLIVIASHYVLLTAMSESVRTVLLESTVMTAFTIGGSADDIHRWTSVFVPLGRKRP